MKRKIKFMRKENRRFRFPLFYLYALGLITVVAGLVPLAAAVQPPKTLNGQIISSPEEIIIPTAVDGFADKLKRQDRKVYTHNAEGRYVIHYVAFFKRSLPTQQVGIVVLDANNEPVTLAYVPGKHGQTSLSSLLEVDPTSTPNKKHTIKIFYAKGNRPVELAAKEVILK